jgi:hypothetical protein
MTTGTANPDRAVNPFWVEMARRRWTPSRARLHFADSTPEETASEPSEAVSNDDRTLEELAAEMERAQAALDTLEAQLAEGSELDEEALGALADDALLSRPPSRPIEDVVWTAEREDALLFTLADGCRIQIGGRISAYGDDEKDAWVYNDIIVRNPAGDVEVYTYPKAIFPPMETLVGARHAGRVVMVGMARAEDGAEWRLRVLIVDVNTFEIMPAPSPPLPIAALTPNLEADGRLVFPVMSDDASEPPRVIALDLDRLAWGAPEPLVEP